MTYIFLTPELGSMGGSQMYVCNKSAYLRLNGWNVKIVYFTESKLLISKLSEFERYYVPEIAWGLQHYLPVSVKKIVNKLTDLLSVDDNSIIVESCLFHLSFWGELLASKIRAKHILHFLEEEIPFASSRIANYLEFKLFRWECMNASEMSLKRLFKTHYKPEYKKFEFKTDFFCSNVFQDDSILDGGIEIGEADDTILSIGRLDKPYINEMLSQIITYANKYSDRIINMVFIGGSSDGTVEEKIKQLFSGILNVHVYLLGYLFPVPSSIVKLANVSIATSNSVLISYSLNVPTIAVDAHDSYAIGLYGDETMNKVFRQAEPQTPINDYLEQVLIKKDFKRLSNPPKENNINQLLEEHFRNQLLFLNRSRIDGSYYNTYNLYPFYKVLSGTLVRSIFKVKELCLHIF